MEQKTTLKQSGDTQLWVVKSESWALPVHATPMVDDAGKAYWIVKQALPFCRAAWYDALCERIKPFNVSVAGDWIVVGESLEKFAEKAPGITPEYYAKWEGDVLAVPDRHAVLTESLEEPQTNEVRAFLEFAFKKHQVVPREQLKLVYASLRQCALDWILVHRKTLDLGFCRIAAVPLRANWKSFLDSWIPKRVLNKHGHELAKELDAIEFDAMLCNSQLAAMHRHHKHIYWSLEIKPEVEWTRAVEDVESKRRHARGDVSYAEYFKKAVLDARDRILEFYLAWVAERGRPTGYVSEGGYPGSEILLPSAATSRMVPQNDRCRPVLAGPRDRIAEQRLLPAGGVSQDAAVPQVSAVQPEVAYMRHPGDYMGRPGAGKQAK